MNPNKRLLKLEIQLMNIVSYKIMDQIKEPSQNSKRLFSTQVLSENQENSYYRLDK